MTDIGSSLLAASIMIGMISVPVASQTVDDVETFSDDLPSISDDELVQENEVTNQTSERFTRQISTAFQEIKTEVTSEGAETLVRDAETELSIERSPEATVWMLETPEANLEVETTATETVRTVETPQGTLEKRTVQGGTSENFDGADRQKVEAEMERLEEVMESKKEEVEEVSEEATSDHYGQKLGLEVQPEGESEHVIIENKGTESIDLDGWQISDRGNYHYDFEDVELSGGSKLYLYTNEKEDVETEDGEGINLYDSGILWNQQGDEARLKGSEGEELVTESY